MANTLSDKLSAWRGTNQGGTGHNGLLSKLSIDGSLYDIKDPALDYLASEIETRLSDIETSTIRDEALTKAGNAGKFATSVTQGTDGQISVTYADVRSTALEDTAVTGQYITSVSQGTDGQVSITRSTVAAENVTFAATSGVDLSSTNVKAAIEEVLSDAMALKGTSSDAAAAETIAGAKAYADAAVAALAGQDWEENAKKVQEIIAELEDSEHGNQWLTVLDKLAGMTIVDKTATAADAIEYNESLTGAVKAGHALTAAQASAINTALSTSYVEGDTVSSAHAASYNETLTGHIAAGDTFTDTTPTVKEYVDAEVAKAKAAASGGIEDLDAVVSGNITTTNNVDAVSSGHKVGVKVTEVDGVITDVTVLENDIASASDLSTLDAAAVKTVNGVSPSSGAVTITGSDINVSSSDTTKIATAISSLDSAKANKAAITSATINNWSASYASETLTWTNTQTSVYVPVTGQTL